MALVPAASDSGAGMVVSDGEGSPSWWAVALEAGLGAETNLSFAAYPVPGGKCSATHSRTSAPREAAKRNSCGSQAGVCWLCDLGRSH